MQQLTMDRNFFRVLFGALIGSILEWYDFTIYIFLAPVISTNFFPHEDAYVSLMFVYGVFALGYFTRPLGAFFFGHFGDRVGRQKMLVLSMMILSLATVLIGFLPTYMMVGVWAPILLVLLRVIQGLSSAGEMIGAVTFTFESSPPRHRGIMATFVWCGSGFGVIFASLFIAFLSSHLSRHQLYTWGWRFPFYLGIVTALMSFYIKKLTRETVYFSAMVKRGEVSRFPTSTIFRSYKLQLAKVFILFLPSAINFYIYFIFLPTHISNLVGRVLPNVLLINALTMTIMFIITPLMSFFSDRIGRKPFLVIGLVANLFLSIFLFHLVSSGLIENLLLAQSIFAVIHAFYSSAVLSTSLESVPTMVRYSLVGIAYNISYAIFGGSVPLVANYLIHHFKSLISPAYYIICVSAIALFVVFKMRETHKEVIL